MYKTEEKYFIASNIFTRYYTQYQTKVECFARRLAFFGTKNTLFQMQETNSGRKGLIGHSLRRVYRSLSYHTSLFTSDLLIEAIDEVFHGQLTVNIRNNPQHWRI